MILSAGYSGQNCEIDHFCQIGGCENNGVCRSLDQLNYICFCESGFTGKTCETSKKIALYNSIIKEFKEVLKQKY